MAYSLRMLLWLTILIGCSADPYPDETGAVLHVALRSLPKSMDPPDIEDQASGKLAANVYDGLLQYHPFARPYKLIGGIAKTLPTVSDDGLTYTFQLKEGVRFHDDPCFPDGKGRLVVAEDFVWAFKRLAHPATHSRGWWLFDGKIVGLAEWREARRAENHTDPSHPRGMTAHVQGLRAINDHTLQIELTAPYPQFLWTLAMQYASVYPHEAVEYYGAELRNHPVGTGPFRLKSYNPVYRAVFERNPTFREERVPDPRAHPEQRWEGWLDDEAAGLLADAGKKIPLLDGMEMRFIQEDQPRWLYFKSGYTDFLWPPKDNIADALPGGELAPDLVERGVTLQRWTELGTVYAALNTLDPVLSNPDLRRAIALAYDHQWTVDNLYGGSAIRATSVIPPGVAGYDPDYHPFHADDGHANLKLAQEYLTRAGYPGGLDPRTGRRLHLIFENSGSGITARQFADRFTDEMRRIGIDVSVVVNTFPQLQDKMRKANFQITSLSWGFDYPDAQNILQLLYGPNRAPGINSANYDNPEFNQLFEQAALLPDSPERTALYVEMTHLIADDVPWITRVHRIRLNLKHAWVRGFKYTEVTDQYWRYIGLDDEERDRRVSEWNQPNRWPLGVLTVLILGVLGFSIRELRP